MGRLTLFLLGSLISGAKVFYQVSRWKDWSKDFWGLDDARLDYILENLRREPGRFAHHLTDYAVEWNRLNAQRGAKTYCGIIFVCLLLLIV